MKQNAEPTYRSMLRAFLTWFFTIPAGWSLALIRASSRGGININKMKEGLFLLQAGWIFTIPLLPVLYLMYRWMKKMTHTREHRWLYLVTGVAVTNFLEIVLVNSLFDGVERVLSSLWPFMAASFLVMVVVNRDLLFRPVSLREGKAE